MPPGGLRKGQEGSLPSSGAGGRVFQKVMMIDRQGIVLPSPRGPSRWKRGHLVDRRGRRHSRAASLPA